MNKDVVKQIIKFRDDRDWTQFHSPENLAKSISIESAELLECFQWSSKYDEKAVREELADIFIYAITMTETLGVNIEDIILQKLKKNGEKYPVKKSKGRSTKYNKL